MADSDSVNEQKSPPKRVLLIAFITIFLDLLGFGIIIPIQPFYAESFGATPTLVTLLGASYSAMQFLFVPIWGRISDRIGRRPLMLTSIVFSCVGYIIFGLAESLTVLFLARMLTGFGNANIAVAQAMIADSTTPENRAKGMGLIGAAFGLGFIFGPAFGGFLSQWGPEIPAFGAAILSAITFLVALIILPETLRSPVGEPGSAARGWLSFSALREACKAPEIARLFLVTFIAVTAFSMMEQVVSLLIEREWLGGSAHDPDNLKKAAGITAIYLTVVGVTISIVQGGLIGPLAKKYGEAKLLKIGTLGKAIGLASTPFLIGMQSYPALFLSGIILAASAGLFNPSLMSLVSRATPDSDQGGVLGLNQSISSLARVAGPVAAGPLFEVMVGLPFYVAGGMVAVAWVAAASLRQPE